MKLLSVNVAADLHRGDPWTGSNPETGIDKRSVNARVRLFDDHVDGDRVIDRKHHGGEFKAVYAYAREDAEWWEARIGRPLAYGAFGENLTTSGLDVTNAVIGERWSIGSAVLQVTEPRIACRVFAGFWDRPDLIKEFSDAGRSGTYLKIVVEGDVGADDAIDVIHRPSHGVTVGIANAAKLGNADLVPLLRGVPELPPKWEEWVGKRLS